MKQLVELIKRISNTRRGEAFFCTAGVTFAIMFMLTINAVVIYLAIWKSLWYFFMLLIIIPISAGICAVLCE